MSNENPNQLDRYYKNHRGIVVHVVRYDREKQRVIFMLDGCDDPQCDHCNDLKRNTPELNRSLA